MTQNEPTDASDFEFALRAVDAHPDTPLVVGMDYTAKVARRSLPIIDWWVVP